jgi:hypothetical protein
MVWADYIGQAAGMNVVAIATPFTGASIHETEISKEAWIVHEPEKVAEVVRQRMADHNSIAHRNENNGEKGVK